MGLRLNYSTLLIIVITDTRQAFHRLEQSVHSLYFDKKFLYQWGLLQSHECGSVSHYDLCKKRVGTSGWSLSPPQSVNLNTSFTFRNRQVWWADGWFPSSKDIQLWSHRSESGTLYGKRDSKDMSKLLLLEQEDYLWVPGRLLYHCDEYSRKAAQGRQMYFRSGFQKVWCTFAWVKHHGSRNRVCVWRCSHLIIDRKEGRRKR